MWEYKTCAEVLQFVMNILSSICSCGIHLYIVIRLVANFDKMSQYKGFIVAQSLVYVIDSVTVSLLNYVWMNDEHDSYGLPFLPISQQTVSALMILMQIVLRIEVSLLSIFSMYRTYTIAKPRFACLFFVIVVFISLASHAVSFALLYIERVELDYMSMLLSTLEGLPVFVCYLTTHQHFKCISSSDRVKRMQSKLSAGLLMLMLILSINNVVSWFYFLIDENYIFTDISDETIATIGRIYHTVINMIQIWFPTLIGFVIRWSISGFFQRRTTRGNSLSISSRLTIKKNWATYTKSLLAVKNVVKATPW